MIFVSASKLPYPFNGVDLDWHANCIALAKWQKMFGISSFKKRQPTSNEGPMKNVYLLTLLPLALLPSCHLRHEVSYPKADDRTPTAWKWAPPAEESVAEAAAKDTPTTKQGAWWTVFQDQRLCKLEEEALRNSPSLKEAALRVVQARVFIQSAEASLYPQVGAQFNASYDEGPLAIIAGDTGNHRRGHAKNFTLPLNLSYELDLWQKSKNSSLAAKARARAEEFAYQAFLLALTSDVANLYFQVISLEQKKQIIENSQQQRLELLALLKSQYAAGLIAEQDVAQGEVELSSGMQELLALNSSIETYKNSLSILLGQTSCKLGKDSFAAHLPQLPKIPLGIPSLLLEQRPDIQQSKELIEASFRDLKVARAAYFPTISLSAAAQYVSSDLNRLFGYEHFTTALSGALAHNLLDGGARSANFKAQKLQLQQQAEQYRQTVLTALKDVEGALISLKLQREQMISQDRALQARARMLSLSQNRYQQGIVDYLEVIAAKQAALQEEGNQLQLKTEGLSATISLIQALGGCWR